MLAPLQMMTVQKRTILKIEIRKKKSYCTSLDNTTGQYASGELLLHSRHSVPPLLGWYVPGGQSEHG